jgi:hypothetical protein
VSRRCGADQRGRDRRFARARWLKRPELAIEAVAEMGRDVGGRNESLAQEVGERRPGQRAEKGWRVVGVGGAKVAAANGAILTVPVVPVGEEVVEGRVGSDPAMELVEGPFA